MRMRWRFGVMAILLAVLVVAGITQSPGRAADPEPTVVVYPDENFHAGPGWPEGWSPPIMPTTISAEIQAEYEQIRATRLADNPPDRLVLYQWVELPKWTKEYPYYLDHHYTLCGKTVYLYYTPNPDLGLVTQMTGKINPGVTRLSAGPCTINTVVAIKYPREMTAEEREQWRLVDDLNVDRRAAQQGLEDCKTSTNAAVDNIYVCFNEGAATPLFDAPAYLDLAVGRVRVPVRFVSELMGARVTWDDPTQTVTIAVPGVSREIAKVVPKPGYTMADWWQHEFKQMDDAKTIVKKVLITQPSKTIKLTVGSNVATVDGQPIPLDAPPVLVPPGRVMVPIRFISEQLGAKVYWVGEQPIFNVGKELSGTYQVHVYTPFHPFFEGPNWYLENRAMKV